MTSQPDPTAPPQDWQERRRQLQDAVERHMIRYIGDFPRFFAERAAGSYFYDDSGRRLLDFTSGQMCATLGHNHPAVVAAIRRSCERALHLFSWVLAPEVVELCRELAALLPPQLQKVILLNTGSESNEAALRMAKLASGRHEVVGLTGSFHGLTGGAGAATYSVGRRGYGPAVPGNLAIPAPNAYHCPIRHCTERCDLTCLEVGFELVDGQRRPSLCKALRPQNRQIPGLRQPALRITNDSAYSGAPILRLR
jgi:2,2-dialkylglycine decarboxylase (pyruvate)